MFRLKRDSHIWRICQKFFAGPAIRPMMIRNGTSAINAIAIFTPQSATANDTQSGTNGPAFRNGTGSCAQMI